MWAYQIFYDCSFFITLENFNLLTKGVDVKLLIKLALISKESDHITLFFPSLFFFLTKWIYCKTGCFDAAFFGPEGILSPALAFSQHPK